MSRCFRSRLGWLALSLLLVGGCEGDGGEFSPFGRPQGPALVHLVPSQSGYTVGETITLDVMIANAFNVGSVPFHLQFDPAVVEFAPPAVEGTFLTGDGTSTVFLASETPGAVIVGLSRMGAPFGKSGDGLLVTLRFKALAEGWGGFGFSGASVKNPRAENLPASFNTAAVRVLP